jgi:RNA polymerase sigma-70 factor, ECF subfamily
LLVEGTIMVRRISNVRFPKRWNFALISKVHPAADVPARVESVAAASARNVLLRHRDGDSGAFAELVAEYRRPVYSYLVRNGIAESDRDDLFQDIFIKIHAAAGQYSADRPLHPWLFTIVANTVRTHYRKRRIRDLVYAEPVDSEPNCNQPDGERVLESAQTATWLQREIEMLPLAQREVLILSCVENLPQNEVADVLGLPVNTVKTHLRRARLALIEKLSRRNANPSGEVPS